MAATRRAATVSIAFSTRLQRTQLAVPRIPLHLNSRFKFQKQAVAFTQTRWSLKQMLYQTCFSPKRLELSRQGSLPVTSFAMARVSCGPCRFFSDAASHNSEEETINEPPHNLDLHFFNSAATGNMSWLRDMMEVYKNGEGPGKVQYAALKTREGGTALHLAASYGKIDVCKFLIDELKFDINDVDSRGSTALFLSLEDENVTNFLIDNGVDITKCNIYSETPLHYAAAYGSKEIVKFLLSKGADLNAISYWGLPLHCAARLGNHNVLKYLLDLKVDPNPNISSLDMSPLLFAIVAKSKECVKLLLEAGANPNQSCYLIPPLYVASGPLILDEEIIRWLLEAGADPNMPDFVGYTTLEMAAMKGCQEAVELLFPVTSRIPSYPDWSISGVLHHAGSKEAKMLYQSKIKEFVTMAKAKGDEAFLRKNYVDAFQWYFQPAKTDDVEVLLNRSVCHLKIHWDREALADAQTCIKLVPGCAMAHYREGEAWNVLMNFEKAAESFSRAFALDPDNKETERAYMAALVKYKHFRHWPELVEDTSPPDST